MTERKLTREAIISQALALLDTEGVAGLTMRKLADRVNVRAATLYWYFPDKAALVAAMIEVLFERVIPVAGSSIEWRKWMRTFGRSLWQVHQEAPQAALLIMSAEHRRESFSRSATRIAEALAALQGDKADLMRLQSAIQSLMIGWSIFAHADYSSDIQAVFDVQQTAFRSLDALIDGWP